MAETAQEVNGGWAYPTVAATKPHFFPAMGERSLCGRYVLIVVPSEFDPDTGTTRKGDRPPFGLALPTWQGNRRLTLSSHLSSAETPQRWAQHQLTPLGGAR